MRNVAIIFLGILLVIGLASCEAGNDSKSGVSLSDCKDTCQSLFKCNESEEFLTACKKECENYVQYTLEVVNCVKRNKKDCDTMLSCSDPISKPLFDEQEPGVL